MVSAPCSYSSHDTRKRQPSEISQPRRYAALMYRRALSEPREDRIKNQNILRAIEFFIPHLQLGYTADPVWDTFAGSEPRNIYAIDCNPNVSNWTTRPLTKKIYVESEVTPIQISEELAEAIRKLADVKKTVLKEGQDAEKENEPAKVDVINKIKEEILKNIPPKEPSKYEKPLNPRAKIQPMAQADHNHACIWYARFRSPAGLNLYQSSSSEARQHFDAVRAEIQLSPEMQQLLDDQLTNLVHNSSPAARQRYLSAYAAQEKNPTDEVLKREKREAFIFLYVNAHPSAQERMDFGYGRCFMFVDVSLKQKLLKAMIKLYAEAPAIAMKAFDAAWD